VQAYPLDSARESTDEQAEASKIQNHVIATPAQSEICKCSRSLTCLETVQRGRFKINEATVIASSPSHSSSHRDKSVSLKSHHSVDSRQVDQIEMPISELQPIEQVLQIHDEMSDQIADHLNLSEK
jgi:hypothetical protein